MRSRVASSASWLEQLAAMAAQNDVATTRSVSRDQDRVPALEALIGMGAGQHGPVQRNDPIV